MPPKLTLEHVAIDRPTLVDGQLRSVRILSDVNLSLPAGGRLVIFGPSGSGKTSLLRVMNRMHDPAEGRVVLDSSELHRLDPIAVRRRVGMVFQQPFLFDGTVAENLAYPLACMKQSLPVEQAELLMKEMGLPVDYLSRRGSQLSGGEQQRVALARVFALDPEVLLLDEPTSALDERSADIIIEALLARNAAGLTLVMVTHSRDMLRKLDCAVLLVRNGRAYFYPSWEEAFAAGQTPAEVD